MHRFGHTPVLQRRKTGLEYRNKSLSPQKPHSVSGRRFGRGRIEPGAASLPIGPLFQSGPATHSPSFCVLRNCCLAQRYCNGLSWQADRVIRRLSRRTPSLGRRPRINRPNFAMGCTHRYKAEWQNHSWKYF